MGSLVLEQVPPPTDGGSKQRSWQEADLGKLPVDVVRRIGHELVD